jgi:hypothetical protein
MITFAILLLVFAFVLFAVSAFGVNGGRINLVSAGLACMVLAQLLNSGIIHG